MTSGTIAVIVAGSVLVVMAVVVLSVVLTRPATNDEDNVDNPSLASPREYRIGNIVDAAVMARRGNTFGRRELHGFRQQVSTWPRGSIGRALLEAGANSDEDDDDVEEKHAETGWQLYHYDRFAPYMAAYQSTMTSALRPYLEAYRARLAADHATTVYVHARVGDFIALRSGVPCPDDIAAAAAELGGTRVRLLNGGLAHGNVDAESMATSQEYLAQLRELLKAHFKEMEDFDGGSADTDWLALATASRLVVGPGSFGISAALANNGGEKRSPANTDLNFMVKGDDVAPQQLSDTWRTYACTTYIP